MNNFDSPASGPIDSAVETQTPGEQIVMFESPTPEELQDSIDADRVRYVLTEADAAADLAGTPRPSR